MLWQGSALNLFVYVSLSPQTVEYVLEKLALALALALALDLRTRTCFPLSTFPCILLEQIHIDLYDQSKSNLDQIYHKHQALHRLERRSLPQFVKYSHRGISIGVLVEPRN